MAKLKFDITTAEERVFTAPWAMNHATMLAAQAIIDGVDKFVHDAETQFGAGRLRLAADDILREKFDRQRVKWNHALKFGDLEDVRREAGRTLAAWRALVALNIEPINPEVWEVVLEDGSVAAIVKDNDAARFVNHHSDRKLAIYTLAEIGRLLSGFPAIAKAKELFDGARVEAVREIRDPVPDIELNDDIPF